MRRRVRRRRVRRRKGGRRVRRKVSSREINLEEEATSKLKLQQSGAVLPPRRRKVRERERRLTTLFDRFNNGELSLDDFL